MVLTNGNSAKLQESTVSLVQPVCTICIYCWTFVVWLGHDLSLFTVKICDLELVVRLENINS